VPRSFVCTDENHYLLCRESETLHAILKGIQSVRVRPSLAATLRSLWDLRAGEIIEAGDAVVIANREEDDVRVMPLKIMPCC